MDSFGFARKAAAPTAAFLLSRYVKFAAAGPIPVMVGGRTGAAQGVRNGSRAQ